MYDKIKVVSMNFKYTQSRNFLQIFDRYLENNLTEQSGRIAYLSTSDNTEE